MDDIFLKLNHDEALVFFEWLASIDDKPDSPFRDEAERSVLWNLEGQLQPLLAEILMENYLDRVAQAKRNLVGME